MHHTAALMLLYGERHLSSHPLSAIAERLRKGKETLRLWQPKALPG